jgi:hypothetical protein
MKVDIKADTPLSVLLHLHPEAETILQEHFKNINFSSITERVKTLEDIAKEEKVDLDEIMENLKQKLEK